MTAEMLARCHLETLLPLRNPSGDPSHAVIQYAEACLRLLGRDVHRDEFGNLYAPALAPLPVFRAIVAHTDSVSQHGGSEEEPLDFENGIYRSRWQNRPIGGDDKCGVAIALTIAELLPEIGVVLTADEEPGLVGAFLQDVPAHELMVECDRRGDRELVHTMQYDKDRYVRVLSDEATRAAIDLLPHRVATVGGGTDVGAFVLRGLARNALNLSVGYYEPHTTSEYVVLSTFLSTLHDAMTLLTCLPDGLAATPGKVSVPLPVLPRRRKHHLFR